MENEVKTCLVEAVEDFLLVSIRRVAAACGADGAHVVQQLLRQHIAHTPEEPAPADQQQ